MQSELVQAFIFITHGRGLDMIHDESNGTGLETAKPESKAPSDEREGPKGFDEHDTGIPEKQYQLSKRQYFLNQWHLAINLLGLMAAILFGLLPLTRSVERVGERILSTQFTIMTPRNGETVEPTAPIRGLTPFLKMTHYVVVTSVKTGDSWIQNGPVDVSFGGVWTGQARLGTAGEGAGENYVIRGLATRSILTPGPLIKMPKDAIFSESVMVTRKQ